jgi:phosphoadenosine phosphosulfate reductase
VTAARTTDDLREVALRAGRELEGATAGEILGWAHQTFGTRLAIASSMETGVLAHLATQVAPGVDVLFLDTGYHFAETIGTRDAIAQVYDVNVATPRSPATTPGRRAYAATSRRCAR